VGLRVWANKRDEVLVTRDSRLETLFCFVVFGQYFLTTNSDCGVKGVEKVVTVSEICIAERVATCFEINQWDATIDGSLKKKVNK